MPAAWVGAGAAVLGVANSMGAFGGGGSGGGGTATQGQIDPYGQIGGRSQAGNQLLSLVNNPSQALSSPGYQQTLQQGMSASNASAAATGTLQSGQQNMALQSMGQNNFNSYYTQMLNQLGSLSGATSQTPSGAASVQNQSAMYSNNMLQNQSSNILGLGGYLSGLANSSGLFNSNQSSANNIAGYAGSGSSYQNSFGSDTQFGSYDSGAYQGPV
jgi:hypothetical protein